MNRLLLCLPLFLLAACQPRAGNPAGALALRELTGAPSRMVWAEQVDGRGDDPFAKGNQLRLVGVDTEDGLGERVILGKTGNYRKPLITPDGARVVFSDFPARKIYVVDWNGGNLRQVAKDGIATEVWRDPATGRTWVYALDNRGSKKDHEGKPVTRFDLDDPAKHELVWDLTLVNPDNFQLTRDGTRAAGLYPWNSGGIAKLPNGGYKQTGKGCWTSMCPDDSGVMWIFDGAHKNLILHTGEGLPARRIPVNTMPDAAAHEVYHPRWSNHPRYLAITGPYRQQGLNNSITGGGSDIHIYAGRFDAATTKVEAWAQISRNRNANFFPDLWVKDGERAESGFQAAAAPNPAGETAPWPGDPAGLVFVWEHAKATNEIRDPVTGKPAYCKAVRTGRALHGRFQEMVLGKGVFVTQDLAVNPAAEIAKSGAFTLEFTAWPDHGKGAGEPLLALAGAKGEVNLAVVQTANRLQLRLRSAGRLTTSETVYVRPGAPNHVVITFDGRRLSSSIDGKPALESFDAAGALSDWNPADLVFGRLPGGAATWSGRLEGVALFTRALDPAILAARHADYAKRFADRKPATRIVATCTLLETSPARAPGDLAGYRHDLVEYKYRVDQVHEGAAPAEKEILVQHWSILDLVPVLEPREKGKAYRLTLEPVADHPELEGERVSTEMTDLLEQWLDVGGP
ncbi:MAG: LamG-like jellyroll fold domain-containing protein [Kiritimatiellia bacterium]